MATNIPEHILETIKDRVSIVEIVAPHVQLKRAGRALKGLCPFHSEKTPSFTVNEDRGTFKCFGCGKGGNVFTFLMEAEGRSFPEAVEMLAKRAGIELPREESPADKSVKRDREIIYEILELARKYYVYQLAEGRGGETARKYLEFRGISKKTAELFDIGAAPLGNDNILRYLAKKKFSTDHMLRAGLITEQDRGGHRDKFRDRLMFPITDSMGRVVSFGGRVMGDGVPKYLNGPETEVFHKSRVLYGLHQGADAIRKSRRAIVVEGYMDVVMLREYGVEGCIATMGTALTREHVEALRRRADEAILVYDGDSAGQKAMERGLGVFLAESFTAKGVVLPQGEDPDSFVKGGGDFLGLVAKAKPLFEVFLEAVAARNDLKTAEGKVRALGEVLPVLDAVTDDLKYSIFRQRASEALKIEEGFIRKGAQHAKGDKKPAVEPPKVFDPQMTEYLRLLLREPSARRRYLDENGERWLTDDFLRECATALVTHGEAGIPIEQMPDRMRDFLTGLIAIDRPLDDYDSLAVLLERRRHKRMSEDLTARLKLAEEKGDWEEWGRLAKEKARIDAEAKT